ncbi:MAG: hypothetical protein MJ252_03285 [archaeon]|nr:hypothetical protein [archaeon]
MLYCRSKYLPKVKLILIYFRPEIGRPDYRIRVNAHHEAGVDHYTEGQLLTLTFNHKVHFVSAWGTTLKSANDQKTIQLGLKYHNNPNDNIGFADLIVKCADLICLNLEIKEVKMEDVDKRYYS